ncbi:MAG: AMP-binding protein [Myxococcota bacterium]|nr:AMP-binding protein [Myxococcota bacterium]
MDTLFPRLHAQHGSPSSELALRVGERALSWGELASACAHHVETLELRGASPGDRVAVWTQPALETLVALVAHAAAGYVSVPIDPKLGAKELGHVLSDAAPRLAFAADPATVIERAPGLETLRAELTLAGAASIAPRPILDVPLLVLYTSGTTGAPKGALITARNVASDLDLLAHAWAWSGSDVIVHALPMFHVHGLVLGLFGALRRGGALRWVPRFSPEDVAGALRDHEQTVLFGVPTMYTRLCEAAERELAIAEALRGARLLVSGSAPLPSREHQRIEALSGHRAIERYGLTETLINCSARHDGDRRAGCVGLPLEAPGVAHVGLRLVDDARAPIDAYDDETIGEIAVRGPNVFAGYLNREDATRAVLDEEGWFYTGDLATRAADGSIRIVGRRATDLIKCGGFKVGAGEVESALLEHPRVREAAVIGMPDPDLGERIVAFVVASEAIPAKELEDHVAALLSPHKRPRVVRFVSALPRNAMGKVQKTALRSAEQSESVQE